MAFFFVFKFYAFEMYCRREKVRQIYVTAQNINVIFYKTCEIQENGNKQIVYDPLVCAEIVQPYVFLNNENDIITTQVRRKYPIV